MIDHSRATRTCGLFVICLLIVGIFPAHSSDEGQGVVPPGVEILKHEWRPGTVWERIGKTKFIWSATVRNHSDVRQRVFVYYDLLDDQNRPLASNVANKIIGPQQTVNVFSDSYINTDFLPKVRSSRATVKLRFPN
jgi:hypothetical protein